ncbi:MAG: trypsin-like serine protease [Tissierellia bacterium]|nr:trypsin-like serine protease [Tissierellia bacterium]
MNYYQDPYEDNSVSYTESYYTDNFPKKEVEEEKNNKPQKGKGILAKTLILLIVALLGGFTGSYWTFRIFKEEVYDISKANKETIVIEGSTDNIAKAVAKKAQPSVVAVTSVEVKNNWLFGQSVSNGMGSGVIVSKDGFILTNSHVISFGNGRNIRVFLDGQDIIFSGEADPNDEKVSGYIAELVWNDPDNDVALLKINPPYPLTPAEIGNSSELEVGDTVIAIGNPIDVNFKSTVTQGIVSGLGRNVSVQTQIESGNPFSGFNIPTVKTNEMNNLIQTDAAINSGNSGGPLLNAKGQVIGINTIKAGSAGVEGLGFAIPIDSVKSLIPKLETGDLRNVLFGIGGFSVKQYEENNNIKFNIDEGLIVMEVLDDSPADKAGIKQHDVIVSLDGKKINSIEELRKVISAFKLNETKDLVVIRGGEKINLQITFDKWNE